LPDVPELLALFMSEALANRYCQVGITSSPPALMTLCIASAVAYHEENDGTGLLGWRVLMGPKEIGERVQYRIDDVHHGQRPSQKA